MKIPETKDEKYIPPGVYCYHFVGTRRAHNLKTLVCPYWESKKDKPEQESGYCNFLELGDFQKNGTLLLWDLCKECGKKEYYDEENLKEFYKKTIEWCLNIESLLETEEEKNSAKEITEEYSEALKQEN